MIPALAFAGLANDAQAARRNGDLLDARIGEHAGDHLAQLTQQRLSPGIAADQHLFGEARPACRGDAIKREVSE